MSEVALGPLIGRGANGKVYRGMLGPQKVAVKVRGKRPPVCSCLPAHLFVCLMVDLWSCRLAGPGWAPSRSACKKCPPTVYLPACPPWQILDCWVDAGRDVADSPGTGPVLEALLW